MFGVGGLVLAVVKVGGHDDDSILHVLPEVGLHRLLHFGEHHGADLLRGEGLFLVLVLDLELGQGAGVYDGEGPDVSCLTGRWCSWS